MALCHILERVDRVLDRQRWNSALEYLGGPEDTTYTSTAQKFSVLTSGLQYLANRIGRLSLNERIYLDRDILLVKCSVG